MDNSGFVIIGRIAKVSGLKGSLKIKILTDFPDRFKNLGKVYLLKGNNPLINKYSGNNIFKIENYSLYNNQLKLKFEQFDDISDASELKGCYLCIDEKDRRKLNKDNYYYDELINLKVYSDNEYIGIVTKIENYGSDDLIYVERLNKNGIYIPLRKQFIKSINLEESKIFVTLIEGFTE